MCNNGLNALFNAAKNGKVDEVEALLDCPNIDINHVLENKTALYIASQKGHTDVVKKFLKRSQTEVNKGQIAEGKTPLFASSVNGHLEVVKELLSHQEILVNKADISKGATPLHAVLRKGSIEIVKTLLSDPRVNPNIQNNDGKTPLMKAVELEKINYLKLLLACPRVDITLTNSAGNTALDIAKNGDKAIVSAIESQSTLLQERHTCSEDLGESTLIKYCRCWTNGPTSTPYSP